MKASGFKKTATILLWFYFNTLSSINETFLTHCITSSLFYFNTLINDLLLSNTDCKNTLIPLSLFQFIHSMSYSWSIKKYFCIQFFSFWEFKISLILFKEKQSALKHIDEFDYKFVIIVRVKGKKRICHHNRVVKVSEAYDVYL
jgi:hypothetical protein